MQKVRVIREIPSKVKEIRVLKEEATSDLESGLTEGIEEVHLAVFHRLQEESQSVEQTAIASPSASIPDTEPIASQQSLASEQERVAELPGSYLSGTGQSLNQATYISNSLSSINPSLKSKDLGFAYPTPEQIERLQEGYTRNLREAIEEQKQSSAEFNQTPGSKAAKKFKYEWE